MKYIGRSDQDLVVSVFSNDGNCHRAFRSLGGEKVGMAFTEEVVSVPDDIFLAFLQKTLMYASELCIRVRLFYLKVRVGNVNESRHIKSKKISPLLR